MNYEDVWQLVYDNDVDIFTPEFWANEGLLVLEQNIVLGNLVHRDYEPIIQRYGDTINIAKPGTFKSYRKTDDEKIRLQDAVATSASIKLDQHWHTSFAIADGEESKSYVDLVDLYIRPAVLSLAEYLDRVIAGQYVKFLALVSGHLGHLDSTTALGYILEARENLQNRRVPLDNRNFMMSNRTETQALQIANFLNAQYIGDDGTALRKASLGTKVGFDFFTSPNSSDVPTGAATGATTTTASAAAGASVVAVTAVPSGVAVGTWFTVAGDDTPMQVAGISSLNITTYLPLRRAVASGAAVVFYKPGAVNQPNPLTSRGITVSDGYPAGWHREIAFDGFTGNGPQLGQAVSFGVNNASVYTVIDTDSTLGLTLDRPLEFAIANNDNLNISPTGSYSLAFNRNAIALVTRPLATPRPGVGAQSAIVSYNGYSMRASIGYDIMSQKHVVTLDMLAGIAVIESVLAEVVLG